MKKIYGCYGIGVYLTDDRKEINHLELMLLDESVGGIQAIYSVSYNGNGLDRIFGFTLINGVYGNIGMLETIVKDAVDEYLATEE